MRSAGEQHAEEERGDGEQHRDAFARAREGRGLAPGGLVVAARTRGAATRMCTAAAMPETATQPSFAISVASHAPLWSPTCSA